MIAEFKRSPSFNHLFNIRSNLASLKHPQYLGPRRCKDIDRRPAGAHSPSSKRVSSPVCFQGVVIVTVQGRGELFPSFPLSMQITLCVQLCGTGRARETFFTTEPIQFHSRLLEITRTQRRGNEASPLDERRSIIAHLGWCFNQPKVYRSRNGG